MEKPMKIVVRAFWDDEADVWVAVADGKLGLVTEAATIDELTLKLPIMARDLLSSGVDDKINIELFTTSRHVIAA
jgi:Domain of unknown function (DUF1902)